MTRVYLGRYVLTKIESPLSSLAAARVHARAQKRVYACGWGPLDTRITQVHRQIKRELVQ
jgi:hypothetical protein